MKPIIVPAILPESFEHLREEVEHVKSAVKMVQIDVVDGMFAPTKTWPYENDGKWGDIVDQKEGLPYWEKIEYEVDLMVEDQIVAAKEWISAGVSRVIAHIESFDDEDVWELKGLCDNYGVDLVLSLVPSTELSVLDPYLDDIKGVQFMGNDKIGYHGVELDEKVLAKISELRMKKPDLDIGIDIGVNEDTIPILFEAGVNRFASGSMVLESENPRDVIREVLEGLE